jgi:hypothetical protein
MKFLTFALLLTLMHGCIYLGQKFIAYYKSGTAQGFILLIKRMLKG